MKKQIQVQDVGAVREAAGNETNGSDFIDTTELIARLKISRGTANNYRKSGLIPFIKMQHAIRYHWPTVETTLVRMQRGN